MADWRDGNNKAGGNEKGERDKSKRLPVVPRATPAPPKTEAPTPRGWRRNKGSETSGTTTIDRSWTGSTRSTSPPTGSLVKLSIVGGLGLAIAVLFINFLWQILYSAPGLPIIVSVAGEYSALDLTENPFGKKSFDQIAGLSGKTKNLTIISSNKERDEFVQEVNSNADWLSGFSGTKVLASQKIMLPGNKNLLLGGGPGKNVTAYFVSCRIARASDGEWVLLYHEDDPYRLLSGNDTPKNQTVGITAFLERVGNCTQADCYAWIILDIKPPSVITNVSDMEFPLEAFEVALKNLSASIRDKLILTLPCDQSEESWMAPEFTSSAFAHFFWAGVLNGFELPKGAITLESFEKTLSGKVEKWVALNRHAQQTPKFLMSENTAKSKNKIQLFNTDSTTSAKLKLATTNSGNELQPKFEELDKLWERFKALEVCIQSNPIAHATIESQLLQMEDLAESNSNRWNEFAKRASKDIDDLEAESKFERRVSLIESALHSEVRSSDIFDRNLLKECKSKAAPWIENPPFWRDSPSPATANPTTRNNRCLQVWTVLQQIARSDDASLWSEFFAADRLQQCLNYAGPNDREKNPEWLEIQLLQILRDALIGEGKTDASSKAIALAINAFSDINDIAFAPNPELSRWTRNELLELDSTFLAAIDHLIANQFELCTEKILSIKENIRKLEQSSRDLNDSMLLRDRTIRLTPHLLAGWMREFRYDASLQSDGVRLARELAQATTQAHQLKETLSEGNFANSASVGIARDSQLTSLVDGIENMFREFEKLAPNDPETIRKCRTALRWPLLDINVRKTFHSQLSRFYQRDAGAAAAESSGEVPKLIHQAPGSVVKSFQDNLGEFRDKELYMVMMQQDPRFAILAQLANAKTLSTVPNEDRRGILKSIYATDYSTRVLANAIGQRVFSGQQRKDEWPWNAAKQFYDVNLNYYSHLQTERLNLARWGDGNLDDPQVKGKYYFERLVDAFQTAAPALNGFDQASQLASSFAAAYTQTKEVGNAVGKIGFAIAPVEADEAADKNSFRIPLEGKDKSAAGPSSLTAVSIGRTVRKPFKTNRGNPWVAPIPLNSPMRMLDVSQENILNEELFVSHRGHYRGYPIPLPKLADNTKIEFKRAANQGSTLRVASASAEPITLMVLLDCSYSMSYKGIHAEARTTVQSLLRRIQELNQGGESQINVCLIVFGRKIVDAVEDAIPAEFTKRNVSKQVYATSIKEGANIKALEDLVRNSDWLRPSGVTPLYDAIDLACELGTNDERTRIVVVSDGSNDIFSDSYTYKGPPVTMQELKAKLLKSKASLYVFQYDFKGMGFYADKGEETRKSIAKSDVELKELVNAIAIQAKMKGLPEILFDNFESMRKAIEDSLPFSTVAVVAGDKTIAQGRFGEDISIPVIPATEARVEILSRGDSQKTNIRISGNERMELKYSSFKNELRFIQFDEDRILRELGEFKLPLKSGLEQRSPLALLAKPIPDQRNFRLKLEIAIRRESKMDEEKSFTRRPAFVAAEMLPSDNERNESMLVSDFDFLLRTHYPVLQTPLIPMSDKEWESNRLDLRVWVADQLPSFAKTFLVRSGETLSVLDEQIAIRRVGNTVTAKIAPSKERFFILCPASKSATRQWSGKREQKVEFEFDDSKLETPVEIQVVKWSDLDRAESEDGLYLFSFKSRPFKK